MRSTVSKTASPRCSRTVSPRMRPSSRMSSRSGRSLSSLSGVIAYSPENRAAFRPAAARPIWVAGAGSASIHLIRGPSRRAKTPLANKQNPGQVRRPPRPALGCAAWAGSETAMLYIPGILSCRGLLRGRKGCGGRAFRRAIRSAIGAIGESVRQSRACAVRSGRTEGASMNDMATPYIGRSLRRREDRRLLTGQGQFVADLVLPRMLHAVFVRSPVAHARIRSVDLSRAAAAPGVVRGAQRRRSVAAAAAGAGGADLAAAQMDDGRSSTNSSIRSSRCWRTTRCGMSARRSRSSSRRAAYQAEDAAELVTLDLEELPAVVDPEAALRPDSPIVHERFDTNLIGEFSVGRGDADGGAGRAPRTACSAASIITATPRCRWSAAASSPHYDPRTDSVTIWSSTQVVHWVRREVAGAPSACPRRGCAASRSMSAAGSAARAMSIPRTC